MLTLLLHSMDGWYRVKPEKQSARQETCHGRRQSPVIFRAIPFLTPLLALLALAGCAQASALAVIPATGGLAGSQSSRPLEVHEYALVEQSADNPTHLGFQEYVLEAVAARRYGWRLPGVEAAVQQPNRALANFGFELRANQSAPFGGYTLYRRGEALQPDIAAFWPVSIIADRALSSQDFMLPFVTLAGEKMVASATGIAPWPAQAGGDAASGGLADTSEAEAYYGDTLAYAHTGGVSSVGFDGPSLIFSGSQPEPAASLPAAFMPAASLPAASETGGARALTTWGGPEANQHWALEQDGRVVVDGRDLAQDHDAERVYEFQVLDGRPLYFYDKDGLTFINIDGRDLPYNYDQVITQRSGELSVYNPGASGQVLWFYALRDGLWYYVEAGIFD